ncbi:hypothetical protein TNCV_2420871 [Trichonephila clavipes]|uniref:Uncharacterized protein n=1 Tax=Trichonephila clavipes TaxID=2585209 RepID=A0A8X6UW73_TRICX|nr:hypothetical protein TNCV_2420871 [Trichonephila clavipes]
MDVSKCIVPLWNEGTLISRRAVSVPVRLVKGERGGRHQILPRCSPSKLEWSRARSYCHQCGFKGYG